MLTWFQERYNTPRYRTPQAIPRSPTMKRTLYSLLVKVARGEFQFGVLKQPQIDGRWGCCVSGFVELCGALEFGKGWLRGQIPSEIGPVHCICIIHLYTVHICILIWFICCGLCHSLFRDVTLRRPFQFIFFSFSCLMHWYNMLYILLPLHFSETGTLGRGVCGSQCRPGCLHDIMKPFERSTHI